MKLEILGTGCAKCEKLYKNAQDAVNDLGIDAEVVKVEDMDDIINYGVMMTPALAIDGDVKSVGKVLSSEDIQKLI